MGMSKLTRVLALALAVVCLVSAVGATNLVYDKNGDGKTNVWDLQKLTKEDDASGALIEALGGADELNPNADGVYEIHTVLGLYNMARLAQKGYSFKLMESIDLEGADWKPVLFYGNFDGNGKKISNVKITRDVLKDGKDYYIMGFFSTVDQYYVGGEKVQSRVENLHLENVDLVAGENTIYMGLLAGTNKGVVTNCTAIGSVTDNRTMLTEKVYVGALVGTNENSEPRGELRKGTDLLEATANSTNSADLVTGLSAKMATFFATPEEGSETRTVGIAGYSNKDNANIDTDMLWQDTTGSSAYKSETERRLRQTAVDEMYKMGTVQWTPSETVSYIRNGDTTHLHSNVYQKGRTYYGIPYVGGYNGSYERFMSQMQSEQDSQGRYVTVLGLEDGVKNDLEVSGFIRYMGNNCSIAIGWAWAKVSPARVQNNYGGVRAIGTDQMIPTKDHMGTYGVLPVGNYTILDASYENSGRQTRQIIEENGGAQGMAQYYALASMGDAISFSHTTYNADGSSETAAHSRMLAYDPVIIRNYKNTINLKKSYVITHEQGDGLYDNVRTDVDGFENFYLKDSSWRIDYKYTLNELLTESGYEAVRASSSGWGYIPTTIAAFKAETQKTPYYNAFTDDNKPQLPNKGWYYSSHWNVSATMTIRNEANEVVYTKTAFLLDRNDKQSRFEHIMLEQEFPDSADNLEVGQTYKLTLTALASDGNTYTIENEKQFTYNG